MGIISEYRYAKRFGELPTHAYHPNVSLRQQRRCGYIATPDCKHEA